MELSKAKQPLPFTADNPANKLGTRIMAFSRHARMNGYSIGIREAADALRISQYCDIADKLLFRWELRSLMCSTRDEWLRFDALFDSFWISDKPMQKSYVSGSSKQGIPQQLKQSAGVQASSADKAQDGAGDDVHEHGCRAGASSQEILRRTDFRLFNDVQQMIELEQLVDAVARRIRKYITRRRRIARLGRQLDLRHTVRNSLKHGGVPFELAFRKQRTQLPRLIILVDTSRSMSFYSYLFLRFTRGIMNVFSDSEAFIYHTRLVHISTALRETDHHKVKEKMALLSAGWSGGTRIGECLATFNQDYGRRMVNRRSLVIILSDGLDTSPPELLAEQLHLVKSRAKKIVWLNPLLGRQGYQPLAGGMQAALPYIDLFAPAHNVESLVALEPYLCDL